MPAAKFEIKRKCQYCGNTFIAKTLDSKYCSRRCSQRAYDQREAVKKRMSQQNEIVENIPIEIAPNRWNERYMRTKKEKMHHDLKMV